MRVVVLKQIDASEWSARGAAVGYVYFIRDADHGRIKVGFSSNPNARLAQLQTGNSSKLEIAGLIVGGMEVETVLHRDFAAFAVRGEWFSEAGVLGWLQARAYGLPLGHCIAEIVDRPAVQAWYEWDAASGQHIRRVWNSATNTWVEAGAAPESSGARPGWDVTITETPDE